MSVVAPERMQGRLTAPFSRGSDTLALTFLPGATGTVANIKGYNFDEHTARFGLAPELPRYVFTALRDVSRATDFRVDYEVVPAVGAPVLGSATLSVPAGTVAGESFAIPLGANDGPRTRLRSVAASPALATATVAETWRVVALLGNLAKLLWVVGGERDLLRGYVERVRRQRRIADAEGVTLDLYGYDLGVQRFPPLPYSFDPGTVAVYHLDETLEPPNEVATVQNLIERYGGRPHPGTNVAGGTPQVPRAQSGVPGRFGTGFAFRDLAAQITVPDDQDFALAAADSFTVECFLSPDAGTTPGHALTKHADPANAAQRGWALSVGDFGRGITRNVRFLVGGGTAATQVSLFADETLEPGRFYHVAGVIDRAAAVARLYLDGRLRSEKLLGAVGTLTNAEPVRIGQTAGAAFRGVVDEIRLSRAARASFSPVVGESDDSYLRRLLIFSEWMLPTPANVRRALNRVAGAVGGDQEPFLVEDLDAPLATGQLALSIYPTRIAANRHLAAGGDRLVEEAEVNGTAEAEERFDPAFLVSHAAAGVVYAQPPARTLRIGELPPDPHKMQVATARALDRLRVLLQGTVGQLTVASAFDPRAEDLRGVGRAVTLTHSALGAGELAALAHRGGFPWVEHRGADGVAYASVPPADVVAIVVQGGNATTTTGFDVLVGEQLDLALEPSVGAAAVFRWSTIACGAGRARFLRRAGVSVDAPPNVQTTAIVEATAPGRLAVQIEVTRGGRTFTGTRFFSVGIDSLADGESIGDDGRRGIPEGVAGTPDDGFFHPAYLVSVGDSRATFANVLDNRRMHPRAAERLSRLLDLIASLSSPPPAGSLRVSRSIASAAQLETVGRSLTLGHFSVPTGQLAALCHSVGFAYVRVSGNQLLVLERAGDLATPETVPAGVRELAEDAQQPLPIGVLPRALPSGVAVSGNSVYTANAGTDTVSEVDPATGAVRGVYKVGWAPVAVEADPATSTHLYTGDSLGETVTAIDLAGSTVRGTFGVGAAPVALAHHPTAKRLYVALRDSTLAEIDTTNVAATPLTITRSAALPGPPLAVAVTPNGAQAWVVLENSVLAVVNTGTFAAPTLVNLPAPGADVAIAQVAANQVRAFVTLPTLHAIVILDVANPAAVPPPVVLGGDPGPVAVAPNGAKVYVVDTAEGRLYVRNTTGQPNQVTRRVGLLPTDVVAAGNHVYISTQSLAAGQSTAETADALAVLDAANADVVTGATLGTGLGEPLTWTFRGAYPPRGHLTSTTASATGLVPEEPGDVLVRASYVLPQIVTAPRRTTSPYTFAVRLKDALQQDPAVVVRKDQYDLVMNVLNAFHPVGVEVATEALREKVIEVRENLMDVFPGYTYPDFRSRGADPRRRRVRGETRTNASD